MSDPLDALRHRFLERCAADLALMAQGLDDAAAAGSPAFAEAVHKLSGAAGVFGFSDISHLAAQVDDDLMSGQPPSQAGLAALIAALRSALAAR